MRLRERLSCRGSGVNRSRPSRPVRMMEPSEGAGVDGGGVMDCIRGYVCNMCRRLASAQQLSAYGTPGAELKEKGTGTPEMCTCHFGDQGSVMKNQLLEWLANEFLLFLA